MVVGHGVLRLARAAAVLVALIPVACTGPPPTHTEEIAAWRTEKDAFMRTSRESPVPAAKRGAFPALPYYPIDEQYRVPAALKVVGSEQIIELSLSTGQRRQMRRIGTLRFTLKGDALSLTAFADIGDTQLRRLFVPFGDLTSGTETYQGGRYIDLDRTGSGIYDLDFNRAYHPFCVFDSKYECPIPPPENRLKLPIRAGEKLP